MPSPAHLVLKKSRRETISSPMATPVIPGEFFRDSIPSLHEDPFIPSQLRVSSFNTLATLLPLDNLTYLDLSYNAWLKELPVEVLKCSNLRKIDISGCHNLIDGALPGCLAELEALEWIAADNCDLTSIDLEISSLPALHTLSLKYNKLDFLPPHLARLYPHLKLLALEGNPCYSSLLPKTRLPDIPPPPPVTPPTRPVSRNLPSFPRLRHAKSSPNLPRARSKTISVLPTRESRNLSPENPRKSFFRQFTPPLPSFVPRRPPRPDAVKIRETAEVVEIAKELQWPVGPTPGPLIQNVERNRNSESGEESDSNLSFESSPASSISSPFAKTSVVALQGSEDIGVDEKELTVKVLSRLRDLWELSTGWVCLSDCYTSRVEEKVEMDEFAKGLGIRLEQLDEVDENDTAAVDVVKKIMGENTNKRAKIVKEIIETEESYIRGLQELVDIYIDNTTNPLAPADDSRVVFRHVKTLLNFHKNFFLPSLVQATQQPRTHSGQPDTVTITCDAVGTVFEENADFMKMYFEYINNFDEAVRIVEKWQTKEGGDPTGSRFLKSRMQDERHSQLNLLGYLLLPVQRVPRYRLLLADLVHSTDAPSSRLRAGFDKIECLAREINDRKAEMEGRRRLVELEHTVISPPSSSDGEDMRLTSSKFVDPARRLVKEDFLEVIVRRKKVPGGLTWEKALETKCLAISCSDKLFLCTSQDISNPLSLLAEIPLENAVATRCWESSTEWRLVVFDGALPNPSPTGLAHPQCGGETWRFRCAKDMDTPTWIEAISKATKRVDSH